MTEELLFRLSYDEADLVAAALVASTSPDLVQLGHRLGHQLAACRQSRSVMESALLGMRRADWKGHGKRRR